MGCNKAILYEIADTFQMEITVGGTYLDPELRGTSKFSVQTIGNIGMVFNPAIIESFMDSARALALVNISGALYILSLSEAAAHTLFVIDSTKFKDFDVTKPNILNRSGGWKREELYTRIKDAVIGVFVREHTNDPWKAYGKGNQYLVEYFNEKLAKNDNATKTIHEKFRTPGPRELAKSHHQ